MARYGSNNLSNITGISISISWSGFLIAVIVSLIVVIALIWIKKRSIKLEPFASGSFGKSASTGVSGKYGSVKASAGASGKARISLSLCKPSIGVSISLFAKLKLRLKFPKKSCGAIFGRNKKPKPAQADLANEAIAKSFVAVFNYNGDPIESNNIQYRTDFIELITTQCYASDEPYEEIYNLLSNKTRLELSDATDMIQKYPCVKANCESMTRRIRTANAGTIQQVVSGAIPFTVPSIPKVPNQTGNKISRKPATITANFTELDTLFDEIAYANCDPTESCLMSAAADADVELNSMLDGLASRYTSDLALDIIGVYNEIYSNPKNKEIINLPMDPLPPTEIIAIPTDRCSGSDFLAGLSAP
jgi:hypothetical protein